MTDIENNESGDAPTPPASEPQKLSKERRINLINRRSTAYLLEITVWHLAFMPLVIAIFLHNNEQALLEVIEAGAAGKTWDPPFWLTSLVWLPFLFFRERLGGGVSWGKKFVGLDLARSDGSDHPVSEKSRRTRNLVLIIPLLPLIEYFVAYYGNHKMQRLGDKWSGTYIVESDVAKPRTGSYSAAVLGAFIAAIYVYGSLAPDLAQFWFKTFM